MNKSIGIIGSGSWATAIVKILSDKGLFIKWHFRKEEDINFVLKNKKNPRYLESASINTSKIRFTTDIQTLIKECDIIILVVPSIFIEGLLKDVYQINLDNKIFISSIKGMIPNKHILVTDFLEKELKISDKNIGIIAGPCHAEEVAMEKQSYITVSSSNIEIARYLQQIISCKYIKATINKDIKGIEYSAIIKNIIAISCGIAEGLGYGDNFQAVLIANSMQEIERFIQTISPNTQRNLIGSGYLGDILVTAYSQFSRNKTFGNLIGKGYPIHSILAKMTMIAEGYYAIKSIIIIVEKYNLNLPIVQSIYNIIYKDEKPGKQYKLLKEILE